MSPSNSAGRWIVQADTDKPNANVDGVVIKDGAVYLVENQDLVEPEPGNLSSVDAFDINNNGDHGWNWFLRNTGGTNNDSGVFFNETLVIQEGEARGAGGGHHARHALHRLLRRGGERQLGHLPHREHRQPGHHLVGRPRSP